MKVVDAHDVVVVTRFAEFAAGCGDIVCREALALAAFELAENIVKYGVAHADPHAGTISILVEGNVTRFCATNSVSSSEDALTVMDIVDRLARPGSDAAALYRERLGELFAQPGLPRARLGLLRLAFEGRFRLSASFETPLMEIVAERTCPGH
jgi:hypothetical protein